jgi:DNA polymerase III delta prime subunit
VRVSRAGLHAHTRPLGSFLFLGPTGVGKTQLTQSLAHFLFETPSSLIRIDMSEYGPLPHPLPYQGSLCISTQALWVPDPLILLCVGTWKSSL